MYYYSICACRKKAESKSCRAIRREFNTARILIVTSYQTEEEIFQVLQAGALGYILKDLGREALIEAIRVVCAGKRWMSSAIERQFADRRLRQPLTGREMEVLKLLARGLTNREIAQVFCISASDGQESREQPSDEAGGRGPHGGRQFLSFARIDPDRGPLKAPGMPAAH